MHRFVRLQRILSVSLIGSLGLLLGQELQVQSSTQSTSQSSVNSKSIPQLTPGKPIERELNSGEKHSYPLQLKTNDYLKLVVEQRGIDVVVRLIGPDGKTLQEVDSPNGTQGSEPISAIIEQGGRYSIEIESLEKTAPPGKYDLSVEPVRVATEQDRAQIEIEKQSAEVEKLRQAGKYDQALPLAQQVLDRAERIFGSEHLLVAGNLNTLAVLYRAKGDLAKAEPLYVRSLAIYEKVLGAEHPNVATSLINLAVFYQTKGEYTRAEPLYVRALPIFEKTLGAEHPFVATSLSNLALLYTAKGDYPRAESLYMRSLAIREKTLGANHPDVATSLNNLAALCQVKGEYTRAELLFVRSLAIREKALGANHPETAVNLNNLADLYREKGDYIKAELLYVKSLAIFEKVLGTTHPLVALNLNNLALLYSEKGDYTQAESLYVRSLAIREKVVGADHPSIATSLNNLALLYYSKGDYTRAEPLFLRSVAILEKVLGAEHASVANGLNNLAGLYRDKGDYARAEPLFLRSLAINEKTLGAEHASVASSLNNLAVFYRDKGDSTQVEPLYIRALAIREKALGADHPETAGSLHNLAVFYRDKGEYTRAESLLVRSLVIREKALGADHPETATTLNNLAVLYQAKGETAQAIQYWKRGNDTTERDLVRNLASGSELQKALYLKQTATRTDCTISLHIQAAPRDLTAIQAALTVILRRKGRELDAMTNTIAILRNQQRPEIQKLLDDYANLASQISVLTLRGPGKKNPEDHLADIRSLTDQREKLENEISRVSGEFKVKTSPITLEAVQKLIPADAALVEYAVYRPYDVKANQFGNPRYAVYLLTHSGHIQFADLGDAVPVDQAAGALRQALGNPKKSALKEIQSVSQALDKLVMRPVRKLVGTARHLLISPDSVLNLIPFSALLDENGKFLVENYTLTYLTSGRDLLRLGVKIKSQEPPLVIADPDYKEGTGPQLLGSPLHRLSQLVGTRLEGEGIKAIFPQAQLKMKAEATKAILKQAVRPELLHIATHGYFLEDAPPEPATDDSPQAQRSLAKLPQDYEKQRGLNPLLRSMLFFAGANQGGSGDNDGILTALEAAQLNLWGTKLVVLSACDTGLGDVKNGDGVYGLRRALVLAGSEAQMMSLWSVSDQGTRELMTEYYTRLKAGEGRSEALRNTQLKLLKDPKRRHPFYWASFIQSGQWGHL
ncbi:MAG: tetratricopeptide repeat protein [Acidobacteria bacterium]|nr:tetratricopeptide repeat protein [Acidobacteriota bacterium]